jgi:dihydrolipoamide dehydrogenase
MLRGLIGDAAFWKGIRDYYQRFRDGNATTADVRRAMEQASGHVKVLADAATDRILGVHNIGPMAGELVGEAVVAMEFEASTEDLQRTIHAHPTLSEAIHEAALSVDRRALHAINH